MRGAMFTVTKSMPLMFFVLIFTLLLADVRPTTAAPDEPKQMVELEFTTNIRFHQSFVLHWQGDKLYLNSIEVNEAKLMLFTDQIRYLIHSPEQQTRQLASCKSGTYTLKRKGRFKNSVESGCMDKARFGKLHQVFTALER